MCKWITCDSILYDVVEHISSLYQVSPFRQWLPTSILMLNCPSLSSMVSRMTWIAVFSFAMPSVRSRVVVVITYCGGAMRLI